MIMTTKYVETKLRAFIHHTFAIAITGMFVPLEYRYQWSLPSTVHFLLASFSSFFPSFRACHLHRNPVRPSVRLSIILRGIKLTPKPQYASAAAAAAVAERQ
jgi:hypothetical protein